MCQLHAVLETRHCRAEACATPPVSCGQDAQCAAKDVKLYKLGALLGAGTFGEVHQSSREGFEVAVKVFRKKAGQQSALEDTRTNCVHHRWSSGEPPGPARLDPNGSPGAFLYYVGIPA